MPYLPDKGRQAMCVTQCLLWEGQPIEVRIIDDTDTERLQTASEAGKETGLGVRAEKGSPEDDIA